METPSVAYFDCLYILSALGSGSGGTSHSELHDLGYLACLLSMLDDKPAADWGYSFSATRASAPFGRALTDAMETLLSRGAISSDARFLLVTPQGEADLERWARLSANARRLPYLRGAAASALSLTFPAFSSGLHEEPQLRASGSSGGVPRVLNEGPAVNLLHHHFEQLTRGLGERRSPVVAGTVWMTYLTATAVSGDD